MIVNDPSTITPDDMIAEEIEGYRSLIRALESESVALCKVDAAALQAAAEVKQREVVALEALARRREACIREADYPLTQSGIQHWLIDCDPSGHAHLQWERLRDLAREARDANARNGRMLKRSQRHFSNSLHALLDAAGVPTTYGADGTARHAASTRVRAAT